MIQIDSPFMLHFKQLTLEDLPLMHRWFNLPHVQGHYSLRPWSEEEIFNKLNPYITEKTPVSGYIIFLEKSPIGYIQNYRLLDFPWDNQDLDETIVAKASGIDLFIGEPSYLGIGLGGVIIRQFLDEKIWPSFDYCLVDPSTDNICAIRCYEKLGFKKHKIINTKDALSKPTQLLLMIKSSS
ncbi:Aminoglycoside N(6')-acetyltransferase type 1 [Legionella massiliensis]|uniref:Aminoglycoside N(6')-acetyltransferase type 1 n=1 Tax=Legionella massiliensis TaxID=1034943 RepID=A0A078L3J0_9GAMM|nr:GNAT family N-acetyltransferase [Legionella massiliensis]CDZ78508.1 Aminoglycoside N(6')-acetyltransferase type 1 [Legionella massiliensis]CEE14246.1 Aminoglycoside N(6')-acetyltransferase type 1 [Legionella massiliensis]